MTVITVTGGKGGTGKTVIAINLAFALSNLTGQRILLIDLDVENPCTYTLLGVKPKTVEEIRVFKPSINADLCDNCGKCVESCPAHALFLIPNRGLMLIETLCEGCAMCMYVCPRGAINRDHTIVGWIKEAKSKDIDLVLGELKPGSRKHHEVMEATLTHARKFWKRYKIVVIDTPPGTGKGIYMALEAADLVVAVTEPTSLGLLDFKRLHSLIKSIGKPEVVVVNKYGLPGGIYESMQQFLEEEGLKWFKLHYDRQMLSAYIKGAPVLHCYPNAQSSLDVKLIAREVVSGLKK